MDRSPGKIERPAAGIETGATASKSHKLTSKRGANLPGSQPERSRVQKALALSPDQMLLNVTLL